MYSVGFEAFDLVAAPPGICHAAGAEGAFELEEQFFEFVESK